MSFLLGALAVLVFIGIVGHSPSIDTSTGRTTGSRSAASSSGSSSSSSSGSQSAGKGGSVFSVMNPEGEIYSIDTTDKSSPFYGSVWTRILKAHERGECFRGKAVKRSCGRADGAFHGYFIDICGIQAFLPVSKAAWFYNAEHDACGKFIALMIDSIYTNGSKAGSIVVNAYKPLKHVLSSQSREAFNSGAEPWALAMDYDANYLIFPHFGSKTIRVPLNEAVALAKSKKIKADKCSLTGLFWQLRVEKWENGGVCTAHPIDIMPE